MPRRPYVLLALALASAIGALLVWLVAFSLPTGRSLDARALQAFAGIVPAPLTPSIRGAAALADPLPLALGGLALAVLAVMRHRLFMAGTVVLILGGANVTTQLLKPAVADLRIIELNGALSIYPGSWPSGHSTAAMSLALCLVLVVGPQLRPLAALLGAGYAIAVGYALVAVGYHLPSDVFGGYLVAATFALIGIAALAALEARRPPRTVRSAAGVSPRELAGAAAAVFVIGGLIVVVQAPGMTSAALRSPAAVAAAAGIGMLGLALTAGLAFALRR